MSFKVFRCFLGLIVASIFALLPSVEGLAAPTQPILLARIPNTRGLSIDKAGNLYTMGRDTGVISRIAPDGTVTLFANLPEEFNGYIGPAFDGNTGSIFVAHFGNEQGQDVLKVSSSGQAGVFAANIPVPGGITVDAAGDLFVTSFECPGSVYRITPQGLMSKLAAGICRGDAIAVDSKGNVYFGIRTSGDIVKIPADGSALVTVVRGGNASMAIGLDASDNLYIGDATRGTISRVSSDGTLTDIACGFKIPSGIVFDGSNNLFVADYLADAIYKIPADTLKVSPGCSSPEQLKSFASLSAQVTIPDESSLTLTMRFTLDSTDATFDLSQRPVTFTVGSITKQIAAGAFRATSAQQSEYIDTANGIERAVLRNLGDGQYEMEIDLRGVTLSTVPIPLPVSLEIGNYNGSILLRHLSSE